MAASDLAAACHYHDPVHRIHQPASRQRHQNGRALRSAGGGTVRHLCLVRRNLACVGCGDLSARRDWRACQRRSAHDRSRLAAQPAQRDLCRIVADRQRMGQPVFRHSSHKRDVWIVVGTVCVLCAAPRTSTDLAPKRETQSTVYAGRNDCPLDIRRFGDRLEHHHLALECSTHQHYLALGERRHPLTRRRAVGDGRLDLPPTDFAAPCPLDRSHPLLAAAHSGCPRDFGRCRCWVWHGSSSALAYSSLRTAHPSTALPYSPHFSSSATR